MQSGRRPDIVGKSTVRSHSNDFSGRQKHMILAEVICGLLALKTKCLSCPVSRGFWRATFTETD